MTKVSQTSLALKDYNNVIKMYQVIKKLCCTQRSKIESRGVTIGESKVFFLLMRIKKVLNSVSKKIVDIIELIMGAKLLGSIMNKRGEINEERYLKGTTWVKERNLGL